METTKQAAQRIGIPQHTLYRRLQRLVDSGKLEIRPEDYVSGCLYLSADLWNEVCSLTPSPGRPKKSHDSLMHDRGYRYRLTFIGKDLAPLYAKRIDDIGPLMRQWPDDRFDVSPLHH